MTFRLEIKCDGAAFDGNPAQAFSDLFAELVIKVTCTPWPKAALNAPFALHDINGNRVGTATLTED